MQRTDAEWARIAPLMPILRGNRKLPARLVLEDWLFATKEGCSWRALPERFGPWQTVYMRLNRWARASVLARVVRELQRDQLATPELATLVADERTALIIALASGQVGDALAGRDLLRPAALM